MTGGTRDFHIGDILSVTTGHLVSPRHMEGVSDLLSWMTDDNLFAHQLIRAHGECAPSLRQQFPDLAAIEYPEGLTGEEPVRAWLDGQVAVHGETRTVRPLTEGDHSRINPFTELRAMVPDAQVSTVVVPEAGGER